MTILTQAVKSRFLAKVQKGPGCWLWMGTKRSNGYGTVSIGGSLYAAHRVMYAITHPKRETLMFTKRPNKGRRGDYVLHSCDNPSCVNPRHLRLGCAEDNARDRESRGRGGRYRTHDDRWEQAKLTPAIVDALRFATADGDEEAFWRLKYEHRIFDYAASSVALNKTFKWYQTEGVEFRDGRWCRVPVDENELREFEAIGRMK